MLVAGRSVGVEAMSRPEKYLKVRWGLSLALLALFALSAVAHEEKDPVCGMMVEIEKAHAKELYSGQSYYF